MSVTRLISLVDYLAYQAGCKYVSDLRCLDSLEDQSSPIRWRSWSRTIFRCGIGTTP